MSNAAASTVAVSHTAAGDAVASSSSSSSSGPSPSLSRQPAAPSPLPSVVFMPRQQSTLVVEQWVRDYHSGDLRRDPIRLKAALDRLRDLRGALDSTNTNDIQNVLRVLGVSRPAPFGKPGTRVRELVVDAIMQERRLLEDQLREQGTTVVDSAEDSAGEQKDATAGEHDSEGTAEIDEVTDNVDYVEGHEQCGESDRAPSSPLPPTSSTTAPSPSPNSGRRRSDRPRQSRSASQQVTEAEYRTVMRLLRLAPSEVPRQSLDRLSAIARQMYEEQRAQQQQADARVSFVKPPAARRLPSSAPSMPAPGSKPPAAGPSRAKKSSAAHLPPVMAYAPSSSDSSESDTDSLSSSNGEEEGEQAETLDSDSARLLRSILQRQGVAASLAHDDVLAVARESLAGCHTFESFWTSHYNKLRQDKRSMSSYYEGMALSLILDNMHHPAVWPQLAARRWLSLHMVLGDGSQWSDARTLLPMAGTAGVSNDLLERMRKQGRKQRELYPGRGAGTGSQRSGNSQRGAGGGGGKNKAGGGENKGSATGGGRQQRRGSTSGAGAPQPGAAGAADE